jgi:hypothetical protein
MSQDTILLLLIALVLVVIFILPQVLLRRAVTSVIRIFRQNKVFSPEKAKSIDELGLRPKTMVQAIFRGQQYKTTAMMVLRNAGVIQTTEDGKLYLSQEALSRSRYGKR